MAELFGQVWEIQAGTQVFEGLDFRATARWPKDSGATVDVVVNHAGPILRGIVDERNERISIRAGYERDQGPVEIGGGRPLRDSISEDRGSVNRPLEFQLTARRITDEVVFSAAFGAVTASEVLEYIRGEAGLAGNIRLGREVQYTRYSLSGGLEKVITSIASDTGSRWDIDGSTLRFWPEGEPARETADVWSPSTGLESVSGSGNEVRATAFLRPALRPGDAIRIVDEGYNGDLRLSEVIHEVDTFGGTFRTSIVGAPR